MDTVWHKLSSLQTQERGKKHYSFLLILYGEWRARKCIKWPINMFNSEPIISYDTNSKRRFRARNEVDFKMNYYITFSAAFSFHRIRRSQKKRDTSKIGRRTSFYFIVKVRTDFNNKESHISHIPTSFDLLWSNRYSIYRKEHTKWYKEINYHVRMKYHSCSCCTAPAGQNENFGIPTYIYFRINSLTECLSHVMSVMFV